MITVVDYGMGNLRSIRRAFEEIGCDVQVTSNAEVVSRATALVLPGVGAFGDAVKRIDNLHLREPLVRHVAGNKPLLGICLGMQLLFESSEESAGVKGLGILPGAVKKFVGNVKVPHIGWNDVVPSAGSRLFGVETTCFYFVHSFYVQSDKCEIGASEYGVRFSAAVRSENVFGVQFHPEKSQAAGQELLRNFVQFT